MSGGNFAPSHIIDRDRAHILDAARSVEQNNGDAPLSEPLQVTGIALHRGNQESLRALLLEHLKVMIFLIYRIVRIAQDNHVPGLVGQVLDTPRNFCEKRIGHIKHNQADVLACACT